MYQQRNARLQGACRDVTACHVSVKGNRQRDNDIQSRINNGDGVWTYAKVSGCRKEKVCKIAGV